MGCISFDSYIKPQLWTWYANISVSCISFDSYIKPQPAFCRPARSCVVYLLIPTSNHNRDGLGALSFSLYIFWFLHQTTTIGMQQSVVGELYIFWFLHQTTTLPEGVHPLDGCISFDSYIKPQLSRLRQVLMSGCISFDSYIKPQLIGEYGTSSLRCISFDSYIKPQHKYRYAWKRSVVYLLIPTSNHNNKPS